METQTWSQARLDTLLEWREDYAEIRDNLHRPTDISERKIVMEILRRLDNAIRFLMGRSY